MKTTSDQAEASTITLASVFQLGGHHPTPPAPPRAWRREQLELVAGLAAAYGECEDLGGFDGEHEVRIGENSVFVFIVEVKIPVAYLVWPASIPLGRPHRG